MIQQYEGLSNFLLHLINQNLFKSAGMQRSPKSQPNQQLIALKYPRIHHKVIKYSNYLLIFGGLNTDNKFVGEIQSISLDTHQASAIVTETVIYRHSFSIFQHQQLLYLWGGIGLQGYTDTLQAFDGCKFYPKAQHGDVPSARANPSTCTYSSKYLILFGGQNQQHIYSDFYLLNLHTFTWSKLQPSCELPVPYLSSMCWISGRAILLLNQCLDEKKKIINKNIIFELWMQDYRTNSLTVSQISVPDVDQLNLGTPSSKKNILSHALKIDSSTVMLLGANQCYKLNLNTFDFQLEKLPFTLSRMYFEPYFHKNTIYLISGIKTSELPIKPSSKLSSSTWAQNLSVVPPHHRRHVCNYCRFYFDQQYTNLYELQEKPIKLQYDYNYYTKIDNKAMVKIASQIRAPQIAVSNIFECLNALEADRVAIEVTPQFYLKVSSSHKHKKILKQLPNAIFPNSSKPVEPSLLQNIQFMKICLLRLGHSVVIAINNIQSTYICYFSCIQSNCPQTLHRGFASFHYSITKQGSNTSQMNSLQRNMVKVNLAHFVKQSQYEHLGQNDISIFVVGLGADEQRVSNGHLMTDHFDRYSPHVTKFIDHLLQHFRFLYLNHKRRPQLTIQKQQHTFLDVYLQYSKCKELILKMLSPEDRQIIYLKQTKLYECTETDLNGKIFLIQRGRTIGKGLKCEGICGVVAIREDIPILWTHERVQSDAHEKAVHDFIFSFLSKKRPLSFS